MMLVSTKPLEDQPVGSEESFSFRRDEVDGMGWGLLAEGRLIKLRKGFLVDLRASWQAATQCDRCLRTFSLPLAAELEDSVANPDAAPETELRLDGTDLDVEPLVREAGVLAWPPKVLCREDCKGLCPSCGKDLNEGLCGCGGAPLASPFNTLKNLHLEDD